MSLFSTAPDICPSGWILWNTMCYFFSDGSNSTWYEARQECQRVRGGDLVSILSVAENDFVKSKIQRWVFVKYGVGILRVGHWEFSVACTEKHRLWVSWSLQSSFRIVNQGTILGADLCSQGQYWFQKWFLKYEATEGVLVINSNSSKAHRNSAVPLTRTCNQNMRSIYRSFPRSVLPSFNALSLTPSLPSLTNV